MRPAGHERSAWAVEASEIHAVLERAVTGGQVMTTIFDRRHASMHARTEYARLFGTVVGLAFRAAEIVYDAVQTGAANVRRLEGPYARLP